MNIIKAIKNLKDDYKKVCNRISKIDADFCYDKNIYVSVVCAEDVDFMKHKGISFKSLVRALIKKHGGASTITMQTVRVITGRYEIDFKRKIREILLSFLIELHYDKISIINSYLKYSFFGSGMNGIEEILSVFFPNKKKLTQIDCIFIASLLKRPAPKQINICWAYKLNHRIIYVENKVNNKGCKILKQIESYISKKNKK
ncbi:biosynthetic peptidoglycan transglycosylase [Thorsellia kenyensis]|uniref:Biosynthetic peptidoglycan transglycosylase n=1 Tax=Thorsellia kenyensis TaxID=1549888 RepID=A0ABV6CCC1_9GAMM